MPDDFIAARPSPLVRGAAATVLPLVLSRVLGIVGVDYDPEDLGRVRALRSRRVLLTPNHPSNTEPALLFHLSCVVGQPFSFLACREAFDPAWGLWGQVIRRIGAFSVVRGTADRTSFRATREALSRPGSKVVVFPEGEVYSQNDSLLPFHAGVFQLAFWTLEDLHKAEADDPSLFVLPVALRYHFTRDMTADLDASVARLERFNGVVAAPGDALYARLRRVGVAMLRSVEREYRLPSARRDDEADLTPRMDAIKEAILQRVATAAGVPLPKGETLPERMRALIHAIEVVTREDADESDDNASRYDALLRRQQRERARPLLYDLERLANYIALYDGYVRADPTPERMADTLQRLERECFGRAILRGPRRCRVRVGEPIDLAPRFAAYQKDRRGAVSVTAHEVESAVAALLHRA